MTKPVTMRQALQTLNGPEPSTVELFIQHVNSCFASKLSMEKYRASKKMGHFYQLSIDHVASPNECLLIEQAFKPGWPAVKVVYWRGRLGITLACFTADDWVSAYNGKPLNQCLAQASIAAAVPA